MVKEWKKCKNGDKVKYCHNLKHFENLYLVWTISIAFLIMYFATESQATQFSSHWFEVIKAFKNTS